MKNAEWQQCEARAAEIVAAVKAAWPGCEHARMDFSPSPPAPRDYGKETADTLEAQIRLAPEKYKAEKEYRPKYAALDLDIAEQNLPRLVNLLRREGPGIAAIQREQQAQQRRADLADVAALSGQSREAFQSLNPEGAALLGQLTGQASGDLAAGTSLSAAESRQAQQAIRGAQAARGLGYGNSDVFQEALGLDTYGRQRLRERQAAGYQALGASQQFYGDPFLQILGRSSGVNPQSYLQQAQGFNPGQQFNPESAYAADIFNTNYNAEAASRIAGAANDQAFYGGLIKSIGGIGGAAIGAAALCWVAREVFGPENPEWVQFRAWLEMRAPRWFHALYCRHGERFAAWIADKPKLKNFIRRWMRARIAGMAHETHQTHERQVAHAL